MYDTGEDYVDGVSIPYIVMEYVDGSTLRELLHSGRKLLPERSLEMTVGILQALEYSHRNGIVHRDIKPANVMLTRTGQVKVMDFGIARAMGDSGMTMTQTAAVIGTAQYLSPEQAKGEQVDARSDLYSTGCLLYELLTVRPAVHRRLPGRGGLPARARGAAAAVGLRPRGHAGDGRDRAQGADQGPGLPLPVGRRDARRHRGGLDGQPVAATAVMGAAGYGYPHGYGDSAATTAHAAAARPAHRDAAADAATTTAATATTRTAPAAGGAQKKKSSTSTVLLVVAGVLVLVGAIFLGKALFGSGSRSDGTPCRTSSAARWPTPRPARPTST